MSTPPFLKLPGCARSLRLATPRGEFAALWSDPAGPPLGTALLIPGYTGSKEDFIALLEPLAEAGYRVVTVDQRGQYRSGGPDDPAPYAIAELGADVRALGALLTGGGPLHLLGHSFGGHVVREALLGTDGVQPWDSLTLLSTGPAAIDPSEAARTKLLVDALATMDLESIWHVLQQMEEGSGDPARRPAPEVGRFLHERWLANVPQALITMGGHLISAPDRVDELAAATPVLPKLVLSGVRDYAWPVAEQSRMAERLGALRVVIDDAGHSPNAERPAETAAALVRFWS
ncbi:alpha/beta fold hydrolase [Kitasatospora sp. NBC_00315]|uniref:alpha/beta fold hydrolase n=1 Tax=Kitasatospora sp. NBC_00315 TaxID=2975963 RepID=UPI00324A01D9